jgi:hypothetical protein
MVAAQAAGAMAVQAFLAHRVPLIAAAAAAAVALTAPVWLSEAQAALA